MNWKAIASAALAGSGLLIVGVCDAAESYARKEVSSKAVKLMDEAESKRYRFAKEQKAHYDVVKELESKRVKEELSRMKKELRYDDRKKDIYAAQSEQLDTFKKSIDYSAKKDEILETAENAIESFKESIDYDSLLSTHKKAIEDAKAEYDKKVKLCEAMGSDISETASALKFEAEKAKNKAVNEAEEEIKKLKAQLSTEEAKINKVKQTDIQKLESQVLNEKTRLEKASKKELDALEKELFDAKVKITERIYDARTEEDLEAIRAYDENCQIIQEQNDLNSKRAEDILNKTPKHEKLAEYLKAKECPKWCVAVVGATPLVPVGYLTYKYIELVAKTIKAM